MALARLGRTDEARSALTAAVARMDAELPKPDSSDVGPAFGDWVLCQAARREAEALIFDIRRSAARGKVGETKPSR